MDERTSFMVMAGLAAMTVLIGPVVYRAVRTDELVLARIGLLFQAVALVALLHACAR